MKPVIFDTGPLVAWLCPRDEHHAWAREAFKRIGPGSLICEGAVAETCHLCSKEGIAPSRVLEFLSRARIESVWLGRDFRLIQQLLEQYADAPMDFTDACVVRMAEIYGLLAVCTSDQDFRFYRKEGNKRVDLLAPFATQD